MSGAAPTREIAYRVFADEFADSTYSYAESDDDRAPQYLVTPTGARINRLFVVGVLTEIEEVSDGVLRARIVDPTGAFVLYAGQYQPDSLAFFERAEPPIFVALTGKTRTFEPDGSDRVFTSLRPERVTEVDAQTRDRWVVQTAEHTLERAAVMAKALEDTEEAREDRLESDAIDSGLAAGIPHAVREYEPTMGYLEAVQEMALEAVRVVAGETDDATGIDVAPHEGGDGSVLTGFADHSLGSGESATERERDQTGKKEREAATEPTAEGSTPAAGSEPDSLDGDSPDQPEAEQRRTTAETDSDESLAEPADIEDEPDGTVDEPEETDELYELSEEERKEVKRNFDVGFESGAEIDSPDETTEDIEPAAAPSSGSEPKPEDSGTDDAETPDSGAGEQAETEEADSVAEEEPETEEADSVAEEEPETEEADSVAESAYTEGELQNLVIETLRELGDGDGVPRSTLIETLQERHELEEASIEDAIEDALLGGRCFESGAEDLKPI